MNNDFFNKYNELEFQITENQMLKQKPQVTFAA